jgi:hypothetical protein
MHENANSTQRFSMLHILASGACTCILCELIPLEWKVLNIYTPCRPALLHPAYILVYDWHIWLTHTRLHTNLNKKYVKKYVGGFSNYDEIVDTFWSQQARGGATCSASTPYRPDRCGSPVRSVSPGRSGERPTNVARVGFRWGSARRVVLGSVGQIGRLQTSRRWRKNNMVGLEE